VFFIEHALQERRPQVYGAGIYRSVFQSIYRTPASDIFPQELMIQSPYFARRKNDLFYYGIIALKAFLLQVKHSKLHFFLVLAQPANHLVAIFIIAIKRAISMWTRKKIIFCALC